ncbi:MAG: glycosyltransferase [Cytophagaceae bacterium]
MSPLVSVIMPAFNSSFFIKESIDSVINQSYSNWELLIIDDCSSDNTVEIVAGFNDARINLLKNESNKGIVFSRNKGITEAKGKYIAFLDSDDIALAERFQRQVDYLERNSQVGLLGTSVAVIDSSGNLTGEKYLYREEIKYMPSHLLFNNTFATSSVMARKNILDTEKFDLKYPVAEDYQLWCRISRKAACWNLPDILVHYRKHDNNITKDKVETVIKYDKEILKENLSYLNVSLSHGELDLLYDVAKRRYPTDIVVLRKADEIFYKLIIANRESKKFEVKYFEEFIRIIWRRMYFKSVLYNKKVLSLYFNSPVKKTLSGFSFKEIPFIIKCIKG